ncbi:ABC transporter substrate-binding protein [Gaoshiqia sp. Z1-71]|uniref:ABC transporter substrate-binding protein n=1 Tax=Gaoshiqia hydrogeniformans TaxID=3290090 RepID=UPI003BF8E9B3
MKKRFYAGAAILLIVLCSLSAGAQYPKRIISLAPSLTKNLYLLEAGDLLVGCTNYCTLQSKTDAEVVATAVQVNYEKAVMLKPDLVVTTTLTNPKTIETFRKLGIRVLVFETPKSFDEICSQFIELGEKLGRKQPAEQLIADVRERVTKIRQRVPAKQTGQKMFMQIGANPLFAVVPNTFCNDFIRFSGAENMASGLTVGSITRETVLMRNPDVIIVVLMGIVGTEEKAGWEQFKSLSAVKKQQIFIVDADRTCSPTPISFAEALEEIIGLIYSDKQ